MIGAHAHEFVVGAHPVDRNGHVNKVEFVRWMNDAAVAHADARVDGGYGGRGAVWVARAHRIEYLRPAFAAAAAVFPLGA